MPDRFLRVLAACAGLCRRDGSLYESQVFALHAFTTWPVVDVVPLLPSERIQRLALNDVDRDALTEQLRRFVATNAPTEGDIEALVVEAPDAYREILAQADVMKADLIVIGAMADRVLSGYYSDRLRRKCFARQRVPSWLSRAALATFRRRAM